MKTYETFSDAVLTLLKGTAVDKGYSALGPDGPNALYEMVEEINGGPGHALGEIIYKVKRYGARRQPEDLLKVAAWAFLVWKHHRASGPATTTSTITLGTIGPSVSNVSQVEEGQ